MFIAKSSNPNLKSWGTVLLFIFGVFEVSARLLNTLDLKFLRGLINKGNVLYFCIFNYTICLVPIFTFLAMRGHIGISPFVQDILNGIFYALLAFCLGFMFNILFRYAFLDKNKPILSNDHIIKEEIISLVWHMKEWKESR